MKVALDIRYRVRSGVSTYIDGIVAHLLDQGGDEFDFVLIKYAGQAMPPGADGRSTIETSAFGTLSGLWWNNTALPKLLRKEGIDLYHTMKIYGPLRCPVPMMHTSHGIINPPNDEFPLSLSQRLWHGRYGKAAFRKSQWMIPVSKHLGVFLHDVVGVPEDRMSVVYNGINDTMRSEYQRQEDGGDLPELPGVPADGSPFVLCVGNIEVVKNHLTAVRALAKLKDELPHHLIIAGGTDKPIAREVEREIENLGLKDRVHLVGFVELGQVVGLLRTAEALLHPSTSEALSFAVLEAMACGCPVIASDIPGIREPADHAARYIADPRDAEALALAIKELSADPPARQRLREDGLERADQFRWERCAEQTLDAYRACLG